MTKIHKEITGGFGEKSTSIMTVARWVENFKNGTETFENAPRSGRLITETSQPTIDCAKREMDENRRQSRQLIGETLGLSPTTTWRILTD